MYRAILIDQPGDLPARRGLGAALLGLDQAQAALEAYSVALSQTPGDALAWLGMAAVMTHAGNGEGCLAALDNALRQAPGSAEIHTRRGVALHQLGRYSESEAAYRAALACDPSFREAWSGLESLLLAAGQTQDALAISKQVAERHPSDPAALTNLGVVHQALGEVEAARASYQSATAAAPDFAPARFYLGTLDLLLGEYQAGLTGMEWRKQAPEKAGYRQYPQPEWRGDQPVSGRRILVHAEQGRGDDIQFCRYLPLLADLGAQVLFACKDPLISLLGTLDPRIEVVGLNAKPSFDFHMPLMSLPLALLAQQPWPLTRHSYLRAQPERVVAWKDRLGLAGFKVGVSWRGSRRGVERGNSAALADLAPLAGIKGVRLFSLQKDAEAELHASGLPIESLGADFDAGPDAFVDSAAVMMSLDLVISLDSALAHLAGALGRPVWTFLPLVPDWRWGISGSTTAWHPTMTLFRQTRRGDWSGPMGEMRAALETLARQESTR